MSVFTRIFPPERRGVAASVGGAAVGVATLAGPLVGGVLIDQLDWQWIFFVNVPIGIIALGLAARLMPTLPTHSHRFDVIGVVLSGIALFLIVFALQEAPSNDWAPWIWGMIAAGLAMTAAFVYWQFVNQNEPLIPLRVFSDRNFSVSSLGVTVIAFAWTAMVLPVMFYAQTACGLSATRAALLTAPMAVATAVLSPFVGRIVDRSTPSPGRRLRVRPDDHLVDLAVHRDDCHRSGLAIVVAVHRNWCGYGVHRIAAVRHRDPQPAA
jgi:MFS family permease